MKEIPKTLIDQIRNKSVVLFLGSGFAYNSLHPQNKKAPLGAELATQIARKFLGDDYIGQPLTYISDLAISASNLFDVQSFIYEIFEPFSPNEKQKEFASFSWKAIFTTNYDLILEKAYNNNTKAAQELSTIYRNTREQDIFKSINSVPYYKLHGSISYINDQELPLILSSDQYISHLKNRDRLFTKLRELALDYTFLFVGYSNQDWNIRAILKELENIKEGRPRSYMISPHFTEVEENYWNERKISPISMGYEDFIDKISIEVTEVQRKLITTVPIETKPVFQKFVLSIKENNPSESLIKFLDHEVDFVHTAIPSTDISPQAFYKGYFENWDPIIKNLDVNRYIKDGILEDIIFEDKYQEKSSSFFFCIKGYAGSGKSVLLRRIAWDTAVTFEKFCIYLKPNVALRTEPIIELYNFVKERIYLFINDAIANETGIIFLLNKLNKEGIPVTIVSTASINLLNEAEMLQTYVDDEYTLTYLSEKEIEELIKKLTTHKSLGYLSNKSFEDQKQALSDQAGRVLLVALHEATGGKHFEEIIINEYNSIHDETAKSLYLTVAILHRLGSYARAGLISRVHGISFNEFKRKFFKPLEYIVFEEKNYTIGDYVYKTRHPIIAQMLFNTILVDPQSRYDEYIRIFNFLDIDYNSDRAAFLAMTKAKQLIQLFNDPIKLRNLYDVAEKCSPDNPKLFSWR
ncbi:SIR2 family protein [bacterium]|nr:MAG: SIR2 family protein [bacterium]